MNNSTVVFIFLWFAPMLPSIQRSNGNYAEMLLAMFIATIAGVGALVVTSLIITAWLAIIVGVAVYYFVFYKFDSHFASFINKIFS